MINVKKGKARKCGTEESLYLTFKYDADTVQQVKSISTRYYIGELKAWEVPLNCIGEVMEIFNTENLNIDEEVDLDYDEKQEETIGCNVFETELNWIKDDKLREFSERALALLPKYFFEVAASSTGKYHPNYALGKGGLVRHTRAAMIIAHELFGNETVQQFTDIEKDIILVALCLHDGCKHGLEGSKYTVATHPIKVTEYLEQEMGLLSGVGNWQIIKQCIESHMGEFNKDYKTGEEILPKPESDIEKFVHMCDYLASRKCIEIKFN